LFPGVALIFMTDLTSTTSSTTSSPGRSVQVQVIGRCLNLITMSTRRRQISCRRWLFDGAGFRRHNSATVATCRRSQTPFLACSQQPAKRVCPRAHQAPLRRANCAVPICSSHLWLQNQEYRALPPKFFNSPVRTAFYCRAAESVIFETQSRQMLPFRMCDESHNRVSRRSTDQLRHLSLTEA
jgi:hypothetical protein